MPGFWVRHRFLQSILSFLGVVAFCCTFCVSSYAEELTLEEFKDAVLKHRTDIKEFTEIKEIAESLGLRVFIVGGLASSYARYISLDLKRLKNTESDIEPSRFGYFWEQVFFPTQDIDLAISRNDGAEETEQNISDFKARVSAAFSETKVDIFVLKKSLPARPALLDLSSDFQKQNTDSVSTGLIELTSNNELKDLRFSDERFFTSFINESISLHIDPDHASTEKAKNKNNPEFIAVLRLLINANRYGLDIDPASLEIVKKNIQNFKASDLNEYSQKWIRSNAKKLIQQSIDLEKSYDLLKSTGLDKLLLQIDKNENEVGSLAWLLTREPLRTNPKNISFTNKRIFGKSKTAGELGIEIVTHETPTYEVFRQILFSFNSKPNAFISKKSAGQNAKYGEGFYTKKGEWGGLDGDGFHIQMKLEQNAVQNIDFDIFDDSIVLIYNKDKVKVLPPEWKQNLGNVSALFETAIKSPSFFSSFDRAATQIASSLSDESRLSVLKKTEEYFLKHDFESAFLWLRPFITQNSEVYLSVLTMLKDNPECLQVLVRDIRKTGFRDFAIGKTLHHGSLLYTVLFFALSVTSFNVLPFFARDFVPSSAADVIQVIVLLYHIDWIVNFVNFKEQGILPKAIFKMLEKTRIQNTFKKSSFLLTRGKLRKDLSIYLNNLEREVKEVHQSFTTTKSKELTKKMHKIEGPELALIHTCSQTLKLLSKTDNED